MFDVISWLLIYNISSIGYNFTQTLTDDGENEL